MKAFDFVRAESLPEAIDLLGRYGDDAHLIAGGTALMLMMKQDLVQPEVLIGIRDIDELRGIRSAPDGGLEIGALATHRSVERSPLAADLSPALATAFGQVATVRIRNQATLGGNLVHADPAQDPPPILIALGAEVEIAGPRGRRVAPLDGFFTDYYETSLEADEVLVSVHVPKPQERSRATYLKLLPRTTDDYATVAVAAWADVEADGLCHDLRVAVGAAGPTVVRARGVEDALRGNRLGEAVVEEAAELVLDDIDPISDVRGSSEYKRMVARVCVARALKQLVGTDGTLAAGTTGLTED